jgi:hypothetical protein
MEAVKKKRKPPDLPEDENERFDLIVEAMFQSLKALLPEAGYEDAKVVLMVECGDRQACLAGGMADQGDGFAFIMEMATAYAEAVGIKMIATRASGPMTEGQG